MNPSRVTKLSELPHLASLRHRDFRNTWLANMFAGAAMWTFLVATSWLVFEELDSSGWVGVVTFASMLPFLVASPLAGLLADRWDRRNLAAVTIGGGALVAAALAGLVIFGGVQVWQVAALTFVGGVLRATSEPAVQSLIPNQVLHKDLLNAISLNAMTRHGARFFGLLVAAPLLGLEAVGPEGVLVLSAALYGIGAIIMMRASTTSRGEAQPESGVWQGMWEGLAFIYRNQAIAMFILLVVFHCALVMSFDSILPVFSRDELGAVDGSILGYLMMGMGVGSLVGTLLIAGVSNERHKGQWLLWTGVASGVAPILLALMGNVVPAVLFAAGTGAAQGTFMAITNAYVLALSPDRLRGRVVSLYTLHAGGVMAFANLGYGFLADTVSAPSILIVTGLAFLAVMSSLGLLQPILRRVYKTGEVAAA